MLTALTRRLTDSIYSCELTHLHREPIDLEQALQQHDQYERELERLGCRIERLPELPDQPDAVFVEDTVVVLPELAVITRPGAASRRQETESMTRAMAEYRRAKNWDTHNSTLRMPANAGLARCRIPLEVGKWGAYTSYTPEEDSR